ncbi:MAG: hypothetical protein WAM82_31055 [Thermoanaerobaculia bacterium]
MAHWYQVTADEELRQGEILLGVPVYEPLIYAGIPAPNSEQPAEARVLDLIIVTPSCDLVERAVPGKPKPSVVFCEHWDLRNQVSSGKLTANKVPEIEKGRLPLNYILPASPFQEVTMGLRIVDFGRIYSLPRAIAFAHAAACGSRLRLLPPFCEHFAQAFARCYMRIGLEVTAWEYSHGDKGAETPPKEIK